MGITPFPVMKKAPYFACKVPCFLFWDLQAMLNGHRYDDVYDDNTDDFFHSCKIHAYMLPHFSVLVKSFTQIC